jgi:hypothetical protein
MTRETLAKRFGVTIREEMPEVTWQRIPEPMLKLLVEITEAETAPGQDNACDLANGHRKTLI